MKGLNVSHATHIKTKKYYPKGKSYPYKDGEATVIEAGELEDLHPNTITTTMNREGVDLERAIKILKFEPKKVRGKPAKVCSKYVV